MGRRPNGAPPQLRRHRAKQLAYVYNAGRQIYLGPWNAPQTRRAYAEYVKAWEASHAPLNAATANVDAGTYVVVGDLCGAFLRHARTYYRDAAGNLTSEFGLYQWAAREFSAIHVTLELARVRPRDVIAMRDALVTRRPALARATINALVRKIKAIFAWGAEREIVDALIAGGVSTVKALPAGRSAAIDNPPVTSAPLRDIAAVLRDADGRGIAWQRVATCIRIQYYTGARPGEVNRMRLGELYTGGVFQLPGSDHRHRVPPGVWLFVPRQHKTRWRGESIVYACGERVQAILAPWITAATARAVADGTPPADAWLFPGFTRGATGRSTGRPLTTQSYGRAIGIAVDRINAGGGRCVTWSPNQLRHNFITRISHTSGSTELASRAVGHADLRTTERYIDQTIQHAAEVARRFSSLNGLRRL